ncbi:hypothetical protein NMG60_11013000 [Bertholletia excelsa]
MPTNETDDEHPPAPPPDNYRRILSLVLKAAIMLLVISMFFLFLGIAAVAVLHFLISNATLHNRRRRHRHRRRRSVSAEGLLRWLPTLNSTGDAQDIRGSTECCAVCLERFEEGEWCRKLPACGHVFHADCVDRWLRRVTNCPVCRATVELSSRATVSAVDGEGYKLLWAIDV